MIIYFDGPEKAGKTTLINALQQKLSSMDIRSTIIHNGPVDPDDSFYSSMLKDHAEDSRVWYLWDRGWVAEEVYATLLKRDRRARNNPFLMDWLHGRVTPLKFIVLPVDYHELVKRRDTTDLNVDPIDEFSAYQKYCLYEYMPLYNYYTQASIDSNIDNILYYMKVKPAMPGIYGNPKSDFVFVATRNEGCKGDRWMPLSYTAAARVFEDVLGMKAMKCAYVFSHLAAPSILTASKVITAIGKEAADWVRFYAPSAVFSNLHRQKAVYMAEFKEHLYKINLEMMK